LRGYNTFMADGYFAILSRGLNTFTADGYFAILIPRVEYNYGGRLLRYFNSWF